MFYGIFNFLFIERDAMWKYKSTFEPNIEVCLFTVCIVVYTVHNYHRRSILEMRPGSAMLSSVLLKYELNAILPLLFSFDISIFCYTMCV